MGLPNPDLAFMHEFFATLVLMGEPMAPVDLIMNHLQGNKARERVTTGFVDRAFASLEALARDGFVFRVDIGAKEPIVVARTERVFDFIRQYPDKGPWKRAFSAYLRCSGRPITPEEADPSDIATAVIASLVLGEKSSASQFLRAVRSYSPDLQAHETAASLAHVLGVEIPDEIWSNLFPPVLVDEYLLALAGQQNAMLLPLPVAWEQRILAVGTKKSREQLLYRRAQRPPQMLIDDPLVRLGDLCKLSPQEARLDEFRTLFWNGNQLEAYHKSLEIIEQDDQLVHPKIRGVEGLDLMLCLLAVSGQEPKALGQITEWTTALGNSRVRSSSPLLFPGFYRAVVAVANSIVKNEPLSYHALAELCEDDPHPLPRSSPRFALLFGLSLASTGWNPQETEQTKASIAGFLRNCIDQGDLSFAVKRELSGVLAVVLGSAGEVPSLATGYQGRDKWELFLDQIDQALPSNESSEEASGSSFSPYICWEVRVSGEGRWSGLSINPRVITSARSKRGKAVKISSVVSQHQEIISDVDRRVLTHVRHESRSSYNYASSINSIVAPKAIMELVGHPHVQGVEGHPLQIEEGKIELHVRKDEAGLRIRVEPQSVLYDRDITWHQPTKSKLVCYYKRPQLAAALELFARQDVAIPPEGAHRLTPILQSMATHCRVITDGVEIAGQNEIESQSSVYLSLRWSGEMLCVDPEVYPFGPNYSSCFPGLGSPNLTESIQGQLCSTKRDFELETKGLAEILDACPTLAHWCESDFSHGEVGRVASMEHALGALTELAEAKVPISWESEQQLALPRMSADSKLRIRMGKARDLIQTSVELELDEGRVMGFRELLNARIGESRFVRVSKDEVVALSKSMEKRLNVLTGIGEAQDDGVKTSLATLPVLHELTRGLSEVEMDEDTTQSLSLLRKAMESNPKLPAPLKATLRPYQEEGFIWMCRLARAELGACLADDMGLGKTVQTLALLCKRRKLGPAMVVAPASVVQNWIDETRRFAPTLKVLNLAEARHERDLSALGGRDLIVTSYGIMAREIEALADIEFATVVFDEAHALKNYGTRRCQAAMQLQAKFRLGLTGTPVENHLGEVWSLFQVLVPGLLGGKKQFERRYSSSGGSVGPRGMEALRARLEPFLLRRTKQQVLSELPELHESVLKIVPSASELAFYRALQEKALEACDQASGPPGSARLKILAEITRLRQAAVDPRLVDKFLGPEGAKIKYLISKLVDLKQEGHRALVFTQFLGSLNLVKAALEEAKISCFHLTGATPSKLRSKMIDAFQDGERDIFLISLRAGGTGINLTGADFVFHLDPWWNPAVEDQATARAHRMGQTKPVQVYRLVTKGTIEEKILAMHDSKRSMAQDLLGNLDQAQKLSLAQLRGLLVDDLDAPAEDKATRLAAPRAQMRSNL